MTIDRNSISDKESAKNLKYNGKDLSSDEKKIFDDLDNPSLTLVKDVAEVLEKVKEAQDATEFKRNLFSYLAEAKREKKDAFKAINGNNKQFDNAFSHQLSLRTIPDKKDDSGGKDKEALEKKIEALEVEIAGLDISIKNEQELIDNIDSGDEEDKIIEKEKEIETLTNFKDLLEGKTVSTGALSGVSVAKAKAALQRMVQAQRNYANGTVTFWKVKNSATATKKNCDLWMSRKDLTGINHQIIDILREIGTDKVTAAIKKELSGTDQTDALKIWEGSGQKKATNEIGFVDKAVWKVSKRTKDVTSADINTQTYIEEVNAKGESHLKIGTEGVSEISKYPDGNADKAIWPYVYFDDYEFFNFMRLVFPPSKYSRLSSTVDDDTNGMTNGLTKKEFEFVFGGFSKDISTGLTNDQKKNSVFDGKKNAIRVFKDDSAKELKADKVNWNLRTIIEFFWDIYDTTPSSPSSSQKMEDLFCGTQATARKQANIDTALEEINFIKAIREAPDATNAANGGSGISKEVISDEILTELTEPSVVHLYYLIKDGVGKAGIESRKGGKHDLTGKVGGIDVSKTNLTNGTGNYTDYLDTTPLKKRIDKLKWEKNNLTKSKDSSGRVIDKHIENKLEFETAKRRKLAELAILKRDLKLLGGGSADDLKKEIRGKYKNNGKGNTRPEIDGMLTLLARVEELEKEDQKAKGKPEVGIVDQDLKDIKTTLDDLDKKLKPFEQETGRYDTYGKTPRERALNKNLDDSALGKFKEAFESIENLRTLSDTEKDNLEKIKLKLEGKLKDDTPKSSDLDKDKLTVLFGFPADDNLLKKWKINNVTEKNIKSAFADKYAKGKNGYDSLMAHLSEKGDVDDKKYDITDSKKDASWKEFIEKGPEKVIKTVIIHENEDALKKDNPDESKKKELIKQMRDDTETGYDKDDEKNFFDKTRYGNPTEGSEDVSRDQLLNYLYDKKIDAVKKADEAWKKGEENDNGNKKVNKEEGPSGLKAWFVPSKDNIWKPVVTYVGIALLIAGVLAVIFWKNISEWWNGPTEEQGEGKVDENEEEKEEE